MPASRSPRPPFTPIRVLALFPILAGGHASAGLPAYRVSADFPGRAFRKINEHGQLAGGGTATYRGFRLYLPQPAYNLPAGVNDIPALEAAAKVELADVHVFSASGIVVGTAYFDNGSRKNTFIWNNGPTLIDKSFPFAIAAVNDRGDFAGARDTPFFKAPGGLEQPIPNTPFAAISRTNDLVISATVHALNDVGDLVCGARRETRQPEGGFASEFAVFVVRTGTLTQSVIPGADAQQTYPKDINNHGQIVGTDDNGTWIYSPQAFNGMPHGFHHVSPLVLFPVINDQGIVLIGGTTLWHKGGLIDANSLLPPGSPWQVTSLVDINNPGQILASGRNNATAQVGAIILSPEGPAPIDPSIRAVPGGSDIEVAWPIAGTTSYRLQFNPDLSGPWNNVTAAPVVSGGMNRITIGRSGTQMFFRLKDGP